MGLMMLNSDKFLDTFSKIEKWLQREAHADRTFTFYQLIDRATSKNRAVKYYRDDLKEFADLRNAIVHERTDGHVIAEPNDRAVAEFDEIGTQLLDPPKVIPNFQKTVETLEATDSVGKAVTTILNGSFSQLPIVSDGKVIDLLTSETVVRWLASEVSNDLISLLESKIEQVLLHTEDPEHYCFLPRTASLHEVLFQFEDFESRGKNLNAILITHGGKPNQSLLGIITVYDLPEILKTINPKRVSST